MLLALALVVLVVFAIFKISRETRIATPCMSLGPDPQEDDSGEGLTRRILATSCGEELMSIVDGYASICGEHCDILLRKATELEDELSENDWAAIYRVAEEGSELERVAEEKAGDALEED